MVMVKKSQMMTLVVCKDRDFKHRAVNFMNNIAFPAEKFSAESFAEAKSMIDANVKICNVVVDGSLFIDLDQEVDKLLPLCERPTVMALVYLSEKQLRSFKDTEKLGENILLRHVPFDKTHFNEAFHGRGGKASNPFAPGAQGAAVFSGAATSKSAPPPPPKPQKSVTAYEASGHIRDTVEQLKTLANDRTNLDALLEIGQRFNGIMGAFAFLESKVGMSELKKLSLIIDCVARTYENKEQSEMSQPHFSLLLDAAKCSYKILMYLRDNSSSLPEELLRQAKAISDAFDVAKDIVRRDSQSQEDVDQLLKQHDIE